jgi:hypothetical protein
MTARKSSALVGVFISVTTVPAAGNIAVAIALAHWDEVSASLVQLGVNLAGMIVAGVATLFVQRTMWARFGQHDILPRSPELEGHPTSGRVSG